MVLDKLESQIKKYKQKSRERRPVPKRKGRSEAQTEVAFPDEDERQVKVKHIEYKPMDIDEAIMQMELIHDSFLVFTNARNDQVNVVYRRKDGHYGLIQPNS
jgi:putative sigma-54 modulation protein